MGTCSKDFKIVRYSQNKGVLGVGKGFTSDVFSVGGHGWRFEYYPDGYDHVNADWICLRLGLVVHHGSAGESVEAWFTFSLLDQNGAPVLAYTEASAVCTFSSRDPSWGFERFIRRRELESSPYLGDDDSFSVRCWFTVNKPDDTTIALPAANRYTIQIHQRKVEEKEEEEKEEEKGWRSKYDHKMMEAHMSDLVARCLVDKIDLYGTKK